MKKFMLSLLILTGAFTAVLAFHACSADDEAEEPQHSPQAQLLLQKSREFAKKYNVNMTLNEDNIEETAKTLSVEEMDSMYMAFSHLRIDVPIRVNSNVAAKTKNKIRIRKLKPVLEDDRPKTYSGTVSGDDSNAALGIYVSADASWIYSESGSQHVHLTVDYQHKSCHDSSDKNFTPVFYTAGDTPSFELKDSAKLKCDHFTITGQVSMTEKELKVKF